MFLIFTLVLFAPSSSVSYPTTEKTPDTGVAPLDVLDSQPSLFFVPKFGDYKDRFLFAVNNSGLSIIDTTTLELHPTQPDEFSATIVGIDLLPNGTSLILALSNGNLARIELDDEDSFIDTDTSEDEEESSTSTTRPEPTDSREIFSSRYMTSQGASGMVADPDQNKVYMINSGSAYIYEYNLTTASLIEISLSATTTATSSTTSDETTVTTSLTPNNIVLAQSDAGSRILVSTSSSILLVGSPGSTSYSQVSLASSLGEIAGSPAHNLTRLALSDDQNFVFVLDETDDVVWVYSILSGVFKDQVSGDSALDPIAFDTDDNNAFSDIAVFNDAISGAVVAYLSGTDGISLFDAASPGTSATTKNIDLDTTTSDTENPIDTSSTPELLATSSPEDRMLYAAGGDASLAVITDKPFVSVTNLSSTTVTEVSSTFSVTFQTDTAGTYTVHANPDPDGTGGTELIAATAINDLNTDTITAELDINSFDRAIFTEGSNRIVVFVTDASGLTGRDGAYLTVDRPPGPITINGTQFGDSKAYIDFTESTDNDISSYTIYAEPALDQANPDCPGALTFASANTITASVSPSVCTESSCTGSITGLTNDTSYCVALSATDASSQTGSTSTFSSAITPEQTVGPAQFFGETGCSLDKRKNISHTSSPLLVLVLIFVPLFYFRARCSRPRRLIIKFFILLLTLPALSQAGDARIEINPSGESTPKFFTFETRGGVWLPTDSGSRDFFGTCCSPGGEFEFGMIFKDRYNVTVTTGFFYKSGSQVGVGSGLSSGDSYSLYMIPIRLDFIYRFDFVNEQIVVPYLRAGVDSVIFVESAGGTLWGNKFGLHGGAGVAFLLDRAEALSASVENGMGINDMYLTLEARYAHINSFKNTGIDLSGIYPYLGLLMAF